MKVLEAILYILIVTPFAAIALIAFRVSASTWDKVVTIVAAGIFLILAGIAVRFIANGVADVYRAKALGTAAEARVVHGNPAPPVYNVLVMVNPETGDTAQIELNEKDSAVIGQQVRSLAKRGYQLSTHSPRLK